MPIPTWFNLFLLIGWNENRFITFSQLLFVKPEWFSYCCVSPPKCCRVKNNYYLPYQILFFLIDVPSVSIVLFSKKNCFGCFVPNYSFFPIQSDLLCIKQTLPFYSQLTFWDKMLKYFNVVSVTYIPHVYLVCLFSKPSIRVNISETNCHVFWQPWQCYLYSIYLR